MKNNTLKKTILAAMFLGLGLVLPFLTGQIKEIGNMLLPMHIPVLLCGLICGWQYGIAVGFIMPILRSFLFSMPHMFPNAVSMAFELANRLGLKNIIGTDMIREVMRKIISKDLSPVIHKSSFDAYESIRTPSIRIDQVVEGFVSHVDVVNVGIEAIIERSVKEGISTIIEGVHIVPGFIREDLMENNNIIIFTLTVDDEESHKQRFYSRCRQPWVKRSLERYMDNFSTIRKTQKFLVEQAKIHDAPIINNVEINETIDIMVNNILERFGGINDVEQES